jgi:phosphatidate phosphatase APP1
VYGSRRRAAAHRRLAGWVTQVEHVVGERISDQLRGRPGWQITVIPYVGQGTATRGHVRARVVLRRRDPTTLAGRVGVLVTSLARYLSIDVTDEPVRIEVAGRTVHAVSGREGYLEAGLDLPDLAPGWHDVHFSVAGSTALGRLLVVDPEARVGLLSDIDDTVIHTGLTRLIDALRTTLLVPEHERQPIPGAAQLYRGLVAGDDGRAPTFYVSTGAWNLHESLEQFLDHHGFPAGPLIMTDWGPGGQWLFREDSVTFKSRTVLALMEQHPHLGWVLVGDSGQHDTEAYAAVARQQPDLIRAIYIREVLPASITRATWVRKIAAELAGLGVPMRLIRDSADACEHARSVGLVAEQA